MIARREGPGLTAIVEGYGDEEDTMHPMFVKLYLENDDDDVLAEEENRRRAANRARQARSRLATRVVARDRDRRPR